LGRRSIRTVRQQVRAIEDVGEELVHGGREVLTKPLRGESSEPGERADR
jgi:hypothetical protein